MQDLNTIIDLSHEFGGDDYVKGGGGNTSVKNDETLWVKPSGTTLASLNSDDMVAMNRKRVDELYQADMPAETNAREARVKDLMAAAVENDAGRPSVEAPLHNVFEARYVVHTHPALVNGMTCAQDGRQTCDSLFPDAIWVEYIDPGYTLCMEVRARIEAYRSRKGSEPQLLLLQNHGVFIAADTADEIRSLYRHLMETLAQEYRKAGVSTSLAFEKAHPAEEEMSKIGELLGSDGECLAAGTGFEPPPGPISPDHLVYARAFPYQGPLTGDGIAGYAEKHGYKPKVLNVAERVYGAGPSQKKADLALEFAYDGALVIQLAEAFGGIHFMSDAQRRFIENWEVESYRASQA